MAFGSITELMQDYKNSLRHICFHLFFFLKKNIVFKHKLSFAKLLGPFYFFKKIFKKILPKISENRIQHKKMQRGRLERPRGSGGGTKWVFRGNRGEVTVLLFLPEARMPTELSDHINGRLG